MKSTRRNYKRLAAWANLKPGYPYVAKTRMNDAIKVAFENGKLILPQATYAFATLTTPFRMV